MIKKGQASLEMVIGLIILLVVAGVVISLVLFFMKPESIEKVTGNIEWEEFIQKCKLKCEEENYAEYCKLYWSGDYEKNEIYPELIKVGKYEWYACEDRIYCFLVEPCKKLGSGRELIEECKRILCHTFIEKYNDNDAATNALLSTIKVSEKETCKDEYQNTVGNIQGEDWYNIFEGGC